MTLREKISKYAMPAFGKRDFVVSRGKGRKLYDDKGREYLDFGAGIAVASIGHCHPAWVRAVSKQAGVLAHCSNLYLTKPNADLSEKLVGKIGRGKVFICNSGTEANEALIKAARLHGLKVSGAEGKKFKIVTAVDGFHGRTMGCVAATAQRKIQKGFSPMLEGFEYAAFNDIDSFEKAVDDDTAAVIVEPVQGESGVTPATREFLKALKSICKKKNALLLFDEVQCGFGRSGAFLASQRIGVKPDGVSMAKGLGGGFPIGAIWLSSPHADLFTPGSHGTTFGGNALACAAALATISVVEKERLVENAAKMGERLSAGLSKVAAKYPHIVKLERGLGLMRAVLFNGPYSNSDICARLRENGLILIPAGSNALRFLPALNVKATEIDRALKILDKTLGEL